MPEDPGLNPPLAMDPHFTIEYPKLDFLPDFLFTFGCPIAPVMVHRGQSKKYQIPKQIRFYNIFNLYDPLVVTLI